MEELLLLEKSLRHQIGSSQVKYSLRFVIRAQLVIWYKGFSFSALQGHFCRKMALIYMTTIVFDFSFVLKALFIPWLWQETTMNLDVYSVCNISSNSSALFFKAAPVRPAFYSSPFSCCCCMFSGFRDSVWNVWLIKFSFKPYKSCQFLSNPVKICQILFNPVKYYWILSNPVKCYQIFSFFFLLFYILIFAMFS